MRKNKSPCFILIFLFLLSLAGFLLSGCTYRIPWLSSAPRPVSDLPAEAVLVDGAAIYDRTLQLIQSAQNSVYVQQAEFDDLQLMSLLAAQSQAGIDVRILLDQWQGVNRTTLDHLKSQNVSIQFYPAQRGQINHTKYVIIDCKKAIIYGPSWTAAGWQAHDASVELSGKSAWKTAAAFASDWELTTTGSLPVPQTTDLPEDNIIVARNTNVKQQLNAEISASKESIRIAIPEISDPDLIQALLDASEKLPEVCLILDREAMLDAPASLEKLMSKNIQIRYFPSEPRLGLRVAVFDNTCFILSSFDWTRNAFVTNHEFSVTVPSPAASAKLGDLFQQGWEKSMK